MINWLKFASIALVALAYTEQSHACRFNKPFDPEKLQADVVVRGHVTAYANPRELANNLSEYVQDNQLYFRPFGVDHRIYNSGCSMPYVIAYSDTAEREMVERLARLGFTSVEPSK